MVLLHQEILLRLSEIISDKRELNQSLITNYWVRTKISFSIVRALSSLCKRITCRLKTYNQKSFAVPTKPVYFPLHYNPPKKFLTYFVSVIHLQRVLLTASD